MRHTGSSTSISPAQASPARWWTAPQAAKSWSDDLKLCLEREIKDIDQEIREARKRATVALTLADKLAAQRDIKALEQRRNHRRRDLFEEQDRIDVERAALIAGIEAQLSASQDCRTLFSLRWTLA